MILIVLLFWTSFFLLTLVFVLQWRSLHWQILIVVVSVSIDFLSNSQRDAPFHRIAYDYSCADWDGLCDHLRMFHGRVSLNSSLLLLLVIIVSEFRLELMDISLIVIIRSSLTHLYGFQLYVLVL